MKTKMLAVSLIAVTAGVFVYTRPHNPLPSDFRDAVSGDKTPGNFTELETLKAADIDKTGAIEGPVPGAPVKLPPDISKGLVRKFKRVENRIRKLEDDTASLSYDIHYLKGKADNSLSAVKNDLQSLDEEMSGYNEDAQRLGIDIKTMLGLAQKDPELNGIARNIAKRAQRMLDRAVDVEYQSHLLELAVRNARSEVIGTYGRWHINNISNGAMDFAGKINDISLDAKGLVFKTQPRPIPGGNIERWKPVDDTKEQ